MRRAVLSSCLAVGLLALSGGARANDTTAALEAGGLIFVRNENVEMRSEDLFISEKEVRVSYLFHSTAEKDTTVLVAFPMPDIILVEQDVAMPNPASPNFLDFVTKVDGKPVETKVEQRVISFGLDQTKVLTDLNVPLNPRQRETFAVLDALPTDKQQTLLERGLVRVEEYDAGKGMERHLTPLWTLRTTFYWMQTFPAKKDLKVEHRYTPSVGMAVGTILGSEMKGEPGFVNLIKAQRDKYCVEPALMASLQKATREAQKQDRLAYSEAFIGYVLKTGGNWQGPITDFTLTIDKGAPENILSFCGTGVKKIGPTTFQVKAKDFWPENDLEILILKPYPKK
ncbi:DUF4424 domain-containing protein [Aquabacter sediminis]|uniref:DUF4424 domain-containing protein n=1 Tax=Aquabacter sediminis TaxID=3029197 RepID=UPI00237EE6B4|nr:DUF4424 domain-containing protein [Aquabacter sp. P-9]MDE1566558.1 DUF4424 domain-containing protein [Aquabacter sp. P-9]